MTKQERLKKYFGEIMREFFDYGTPAHYRVQMTNSKSILEEILAYINMSEETQYIKQNHINSLLEELVFTVENDIVLKPHEESFEHFFEFINSTFLKKKESNKEEFNKSIRILKNKIKPFLNTLRRSYFKNTKDQLLTLLDKPETSIENNDFTKLKKLSFIFSTELLMMGYSKPYIYSKIISLFFQDKNPHYQDFNKIIECFNAEKKNFLVNLKLIVGKDVMKDIYQIFKENFVKTSADISEKMFEDYSILSKSPNISQKPHIIRAFDKFKIMSESSFLIRENIEALDYEEAAQIFVKRVYQFLDIINLEYPKSNFRVNPHALCIEISSNDVQIPVILKQIDGYKNSSSVTYFNRLNEKISRILESQNIEQSTKNKLQTLLLFYRYFCEARTLEHKFLNLWIGWEHAFSLDLNVTNSWLNIINFCPKIHSTLYIKQILIDILNVQLRRNFKRFKDIDVKNYDQEMDKLLTDQSKYRVYNLYSIIKEGGEKWTKLINLKVLENDDLTKVKLFRVKTRILNDPKDFIKKHYKKISWELFRMYRLRNNIVHKGRSNDLKVPVEVLVANLESLYKELLEVIIERLSINDRFNNIEQLFLSYEMTHTKLISKGNSLKEVVTPKDVKNKIIDPLLLF